MTATAGQFQVVHGSSGIYSHDVIETQTSLTIQESAPIFYSPGVLIGFPSNYRVVNDSEIGASSIGGFQVALGRGSISDSQGLHNVVVIGESSTGSKYSIGIATIALLGSNGAFQAAETDVYIQNMTSLKGLVSTQDRVNQTIPLTLTQHYNLLARAVIALAAGYASEGNPQVSRVYDLVALQLVGLGSFVSTYYPGYDRSISTPRSVVKLNVVPDDVYQCASIYLAKTESDHLDTIGGTFTSYYTSQNHNDYILFSGVMSEGDISDSWQVEIQASPIAITSASATRTLGVGTILSQQISSTNVLWTTLNIGISQWSLAVGTNSAQAPSPASVAVHVVNDFAYGALNLC